MSENDLHLFLLEAGVPRESLPQMIIMYKSTLISIIEGYTKKTVKTKKFYICVCNSGHDVCCKGWEWAFSGWNIRVVGKRVLFYKDEWEFDVSELPIFQNIIFVISKRAKENEFVCFRGDMFCFSKNRKKLISKIKNTGTNRRKKQNTWGGFPPFFL